MDIKFNAPAGGTFPADHVQVISTDGTSWRSTSLLDGQTLPDGKPDGYYVVRNAAGDIVEIHILTRHLTVFAVLYKANISVSESGRKTPQAGSGLFGDPTRNHNGAPAMKQVGTVKPVAGIKGTSVPVRFFRDEQANLRVSLVDSRGNEVLLNAAGTVFRGHKLTGGKTRVLHVAVLRPARCSSRRRRRYRTSRRAKRTASASRRPTSTATRPCSTWRLKRRANTRRRCERGPSGPSPCWATVRAAVGPSIRDFTERGNVAALRARRQSSRPVLAESETPALRPGSYMGYALTRT